jgi:ligand-binding SRPBCC domain-containing protein
MYDNIHNLLKVVNREQMNAVQSVPQNARVFEKSTIIKTSIDKILAFHHDPQAIRKLTPPPIFAQLREDNRTSLTEGDLKFTLWMGFIPIRWHAQHQAGPTEHSFADVMLAGPLQYWRHEHIFEPVANGVKLIDRVTLAHKSGLQGIFTRLLFDGIPLKLLFFYRYLRTKWAVANK